MGYSQHPGIWITSFRPLIEGRPSNYVKCTSICGQPRPAYAYNMYNVSCFFHWLSAPQVRNVCVQIAGYPVLCRSLHIASVVHAWPASMST